MPILLDVDHAITLDQLLAKTDTQDIKWQIKKATTQEFPSILGIGTLTSASSQEISFLANSRYQHQLANTQAAAVIIAAEVEQTLQEASHPPSFIRVVCNQPYLLYARIAQCLDQASCSSAQAQIHSTAVIAADAIIEDHVSIGPYCVIEKGVYIGRATVLGPGCIIGADARLGSHCLLHARVTLYKNVQVGDRAIIHSGVVLGADGFGLAPDNTLGIGAWRKIPQLGTVVVGNDVEIGANTTIDRGALDNTIVEDGVKLDNQIMVAHNVHIGAHTAIAACVGIAGSTRLGQRCTIGGASMLSGHLTLADDVHISGGTAITTSIATPGRYTGVYPYAKHYDWQKNAAVIQQLAQLRRRLKLLEKK